MASGPARVARAVSCTLGRLPRYDSRLTTAQLKALDAVRAQSRSSASADLKTLTSRARGLGYTAAQVGEVLAHIQSVAPVQIYFRLMDPMPWTAAERLAIDAGEFVAPRHVIDEV